MSNQMKRVDQGAAVFLDSDRASLLVTSLPSTLHEVWSAINEDEGHASNDDKYAYFQSLIEIAIWHVVKISDSLRIANGIEKSACLDKLAEMADQLLMSLLSVKASNTVYRHKALFILGLEEFAKDLESNLEKFIKEN